MRGYRGGTIMHDIVEVIGKGSFIQHGKHNDRVYLMKLDKLDIDIIISELSTLANKKGYSKLFCKVAKNMAPLFFANGYILEAFIPNFYYGNEDVFFVSKFLHSDRLLNIEQEQLKILSNLLEDMPEKKGNHIKKASDFTIRKLEKSDIREITEIYKTVFKTYPFPIHDPNYILKTMQDDVQYFGAEIGGELAALSSAEIDFKGKNAEMTDFATLPEHAGNNLSSVLLSQMEEQMSEQGIKTLYTIARLNSIPMNKTFLKNEYQYSGTLIKNTNIAGKIESMNIYYKSLP